jgi:hypothetical protein
MMERAVIARAWDSWMAIEAALTPVDPSEY